jgi:transposase
MFCLNNTHRYYFCTQPVDMRKSFYTLSGLVRDSMGFEPENGNVYIFINRTCNSMKLLHMETGGFVIYHKRLISGCFTLPKFNEQSNSWDMSYNDLLLLVDGFKKIVPEKKSSGFLSY